MAELWGDDDYLYGDYLKEKRRRWHVIFAILVTFVLTCLGCFGIYMMIERACPRCSSRATVAGAKVCYCYNCDLCWEPNTRCLT